ncbi:peptidase M48 family protein [Gordonia effusa NBRC 100432]|uniref:Peptidase M48 family protein n=1 Tax=Gordonia effusa NBRC 100432 TaxID=1077974 RepID=H0QZ71_9ACTN|nr:M48 family metallopeptidase [Gordonia effusa]GAB18122.1 peptidase M48 family protein [Gordonia effusa NBRC 100432]
MDPQSSLPHETAPASDDDAAPSPSAAELTVTPIPSVPGVVPGTAGSPTAATAEPPQVPGYTPQWLPPTKYSGPPKRHPWEIPTLVTFIVLTGLFYVFAILLVMLGNLSELFLTALLLPLLYVFIRGTTYAQMRVNGVQMTPTQFPEGYHMVVDAAARYGLEYVPDAYVVTGNGAINAFASGHGFRRFIVVYSDLFEIGGQARSPEALRFIIGHEVGHIAAGHTSYWRQLTTGLLMQVPIIGSLLSRAQEYTADNHGYYTQPSGAPGAIGVLAAGKYMLSGVDFDEFADRASREKGFFVFIVNAMSSHPVLTWRAAALRDRTRAGAMLWRPGTLKRGIGNGNAMPVLPTPHPASQPWGALPNGLESQTKP